MAEQAAKEFDNFEKYSKLFKTSNYHETLVMLGAYTFDTEYLNPLVRLTTDELDKKSIQKPFRNACVHHYVPLRDCRRSNYYYPTACDDEKVRYERCIFKLQMRMKEKSQRIIDMEKKIDKIDNLIAMKKKQQEK